MQLELCVNFLRTDYSEITENDVGWLLRKCQAPARYNCYVTLFLSKPTLNESALRDPSRPVHRIADALLPYLRVLVDEFAPQHVILFGSYAYGEPDQDSDIDLLIVKKVDKSPVQDAIEIRRRWSTLRRDHKRFGFDLIVESEQRHQDRLVSGGAFYTEINQQGLEALIALVQR